MSSVRPDYRVSPPPDWLFTWTYRIMAPVVARKIQPEDRAALQFIQERQAQLGLSRAQLASRAGIPYQTLRGWWDQGKASLSLADVKRLLLAVEVDPQEGVESILRLALTLEDTAD